MCLFYHGVWLKISQFSVITDSNGISLFIALLGDLNALFFTNRLSDSFNDIHGNSLRGWYEM